MQHIVSKSVASKLCNNLTPIAEGWLKKTVLDYEHSFVLVNGMYMRAKEKRYRPFQRGKDGSQDRCIGASFSTGSRVGISSDTIHMAC